MVRIGGVLEIRAVFSVCGIRSSADVAQAWVVPDSEIVRGGVHRSRGPSFSKMVEGRASVRIEYPVERGAHVRGSFGEHGHTVPISLLSRPVRIPSFEKQFPVRVHGSVGKDRIRSGVGSVGFQGEPFDDDLAAVKVGAPVGRHGRGVEREGPASAVGRHVAIYLEGSVPTAAVRVDRVDAVGVSSSGIFDLETAFPALGRGNRPYGPPVDDESGCGGGIARILDKSHDASGLVCGKVSRDARDFRDGGDSGDLQISDGALFSAPYDIRRSGDHFLIVGRERFVDGFF